MHDKRVLSVSAWRHWSGVCGTLFLLPKITQAAESIYGL